MEDTKDTVAGIAVEDVSGTGAPTAWIIVTELGKLFKVIRDGKGGFEVEAHVVSEKRPT